MASSPRTTFPERPTGARVLLASLLTATFALHCGGRDDEGEIVTIPSALELKLPVPATAVTASTHDGNVPATARY